MKNKLRITAFLLIFTMLTTLFCSVSASEESKGDRSYNNNVTLLTAIGILDDIYDAVNTENSTISVSIVEASVANIIGQTVSSTDYSVISVGEAAKKVVFALGYYAVMNPNSASIEAYYMKAAEIGLLNGISAGRDEMLTSRIFVRLLINAVNTDMLEVKAADNAGIQYNADCSYLEKSYIVKKSGIVQATDVTALSHAGRLPKGFVAINNVTYNAGKSNAENYLGCYVDFYVQQSEDDDYGTVLCIFESNKNDRLTIEADSIISGSLSEIAYYNEDSNKNCKARLEDEFNLIYNGVAKLKQTIEDLVPDLGNVELIDNDGDGKYEVVFVMSYEVYIADGINKYDNLIYDREGKTPLDLSDNIRVLSFIREGKTADISSIQINDVLYVAFSKEKECVSIIASNKRVEGKVSELTEDGEKKYCIVNDEEYVVSDRISDQVSMDMEGVFYLGPTGIVERVQLSRRYEYGLLVALDGKKSFIKNPVIRLLNEEGKVCDYELYDKAYLYSEIFNGELIGAAQIDYLHSYINDHVEAAKPSAGIGMAAPIIMYTLSGDKIKTISLPVPYNENAAGSKRDEYVFQSATSKIDMVQKMAKNLYKAGNNSINPNYDKNDSDESTKYLSKDTVVFGVPVNENYQVEKGFEKRTNVYHGNQFSANWFYGSFYNLNDDRTTDVMVKYIPADTSANRSSSVLINRIAKVVSDGLYCTKIYGISGGVNSEFIVSDEARINTKNLTEFYGPVNMEINDLSRGDLALVSLDGKGQIIYIEILLSGKYPNNSYKRYHNNQGFESEKELLYGTVTGKFNDLLTVEVDTNRFDANALKCYVNKYNSGSVYLYDRARDTLSAVDYKSISKGDYVFVRLNDSIVMDIYILR